MELSGGKCSFYFDFLWFVEFKVQPYRTLKVSGSLLPGLFVVSGVQGATLPHFGGVGVTFT